MKAGNFLGITFFILQIIWTGESGAKSLSGKYRLDNQDILISDSQKYRGQFDLRSQLPMGNEFVLSKVIVSFKFQDDKEWTRKDGKSSLRNTGKIVRHAGSPLRKRTVAGRTDYYYEAEQIEYLSNEEELAELTIGRSKYFATTMRRRDVSRDILGQKSIILGTYSDEGDEHRIRQHHRITTSILERRRDGYDGLFEIRRKTLDLSAAQDLAHSGILEFELGGRGDYIFVGATIQYQGFTTGKIGSEDTQSGSFGGLLTWLMLLGVAIGGVFWWKKGRGVPVKGRRISRQPAF